MTELEIKAADCGLTVAEYEEELKDCQRADKRMAKINAKVAQMTPEQREKRNRKLRKGFHRHLYMFSRQWVEAVAEAGWEAEDLQNVAKNKTVKLSELVAQVEAIRALNNIKTDLLRAGAMKVERRGRPKGSKNKKH